MCKGTCTGNLNRGGMAACQEGNYERAITLLSRALEKSAAKPAVYRAKLCNNLALVYQLQGDQEKAFSNFSTALTLLEQASIGRGVRLYDTVFNNFRKLSAA